MDSRTAYEPALVDRAAKERREACNLAPHALKSAESAGREVDEPADPLRTCWERDRDRIVHCTAFRRLMYKTQVFVNWEGDHHRTRLSHSLEVAQVARSVGNALGLNEPFCEALALAHDIGHPPFGHRGERVLNELMADHGGFRHNAQVLRVVDMLERRNPDHRGLNLTREVRESLPKHESAANWPADLEARPRHPWLEAQVVDLADSTAYDGHDIEDGLLRGMFTEEELRAEVRLWRLTEERVVERHPGFLEGGLDRKLRVRRLVNELIGLSINDLIHASHARILDTGVATANDARVHERALIAHSAELKPLVGELQSFLVKHFYRHEHLMQFSKDARQRLAILFESYRNHPDEIAPWYQAWIDEVGLERAVCDYIAGMTDRFADSEYKRLSVGGSTG